MPTPDNEPAKTVKRTAEGGAGFKNTATRSARCATYSIDLKNRFVEVKLTGRVTFTDIENYASALRADPRFSARLSEIVDLRDVAEVELTPRQAMNLAVTNDPFSPASRRAFVAQSQGQINVAHVHRVLRPEGNNIRVFFSIDEAKQWIGG